MIKPPSVSNPVLGLGAATWDHLVVVPDFVNEEGVTRALVATQQGGGPVATALCTLSALGSRTVLLDAQGDDETGQRILRELQIFGVDTQYVRIHVGHSSAQASILVRQRDGARHIFYVPARVPELTGADIAHELVQGSALLHINGRHETAARRAVEIAKECGVAISFDGGAGRYRDGIRDLVLASDIRIVAKEFALRFAATDSVEDAVALLRRDEPRLLVITDGARGSDVWSNDGESFHQPALIVNDTVDTTGCGDVFHGAFLHGWLQGWPLRETAVFASKLAAETARGLGGRCALRAATPL